MIFISIFFILPLLTQARIPPRNYDRYDDDRFQDRQFSRQTPQRNFNIIPILRDEKYGPINGVYNFEFETGNGIRRSEQGAPTGPNGAVVSQGDWSFTFPDGSPAQFSFVADEFGYRVESPLLPTPPPIPQHALEQIRKAERERAAGIVHDGQYRPDQYDQGSSRRQFSHSQGSRTHSQGFQGSGSQGFSQSQGYQGQNSQGFSQRPRQQSFGTGSAQRFGHQTRQQPQRQRFSGSQRQYGYSKK